MVFKFGAVIKFCVILACWISWDGGRLWSMKLHFEMGFIYFASSCQPYCEWDVNGPVFAYKIYIVTVIVGMKGGQKVSDLWMHYGKPQFSSYQ